MRRDWNELLEIAEEEVNRVLRALPRELRQEAGQATIAYEAFADPEETELDEGTLGLFVGGSFLDMETGAAYLPPQIILYLETLWEFAGEEEEDYREEVRTTYLHELGHYLGLEEIELDERGLQ